MPRSTTALLFALAVAVTASAGAGPLPDPVLGADGELFRIEQGLYGELTGDAQAPEADHPVLALRIQRPDRPDDLHVLPATLGEDRESAAAMLYEEASRTLYVAWETRHNVIHSWVRLVGFSDGAWGEPIDVSDRRFSLKSDPHLAVTRDAFEGQDDEGLAVTVRRTVLHVVWVEQRVEGTTVVYSPIVLVDGAFDGTGPGPIFTLTDLVAPPEEELLEVPLAELPLAPTVNQGADGHSVIAGFVHPASGRLVAVDLTLLSGDVSALADGARAHLIEIGSRYDTRKPGELRALGDVARAHLIEIGSRLDPALLVFVADRLHEMVVEIGPDFDLGDEDALVSFGDQGRAHLIEIGARLEGRGLRQRSPLGQRSVLDLPGNAAAASHQIGLRTVAIRGVEELEPGAEPLTLLSPDGADALIAWEENGQLRYQESREDGWSDVRAISLETVDRASALEIVENRIRNR